MPEMVSFPSIPFEKPRNKRERITPELPRAPLNKAEAAIFAISPACVLSVLINSFAAADIVIDILVPVSPSGTGKIFKSFTMFLCLEILFAPEINAFFRVSPFIILCTPLT